MQTMYGHQVTPRNDRFVEIADKSIQILNQLMFANRKDAILLPLMRYLPSWFPGAKVKRMAQKSKILTTEMTVSSRADVIDNVFLTGIESTG